MTEVYAMITDGTEEVECLAVVDILRRAGIETEIVSATDTKEVATSHGVRITADKTISEVELDNAKVIFVPGGMPGSKLLGENHRLISAIDSALKKGNRVAAICAAPALVLGEHGFLVGKSAVCYPGHEESMLGATVMHGARVVTDENITTARGMGCAIDLGLELVGLLRDEDLANEIAGKIQLQ